MKKRLLGLLLALAMVMSIVPFALATSDTYASDTAAVTAGMTARIGAEGTGTYYSTLREAVIAAHEETDSAERQQGTIITLLDDVSDGQGIAIGYGSFNDETGVTSSPYNPINITIDLNEKTYTITRDYVGSNTTNTNGFQLLRGSTVKIKNGSITSTTSKIFVQN